MKNYRNISRILSVLLILAMLLSCISMPAFSADAPCAEDGCSGKYRNGICSEAAEHYEAAPAEDGVYRIGNAGQLYWFAALVNSGANEYGVGDNGDVYDAVLTADIIVNMALDPESDDNLAWIPIGLYTDAREYIRYSGTFDGAGHTIYGLYYNNTSYTGRIAGLFGCLDSNGTVKDLTLADSCINGATDIGGIVGHNYGTVIGCTQLGIVSGTGTTGGVVSRNLDGGKVERCRNANTVSGAITGGIVGENAAAASVVACENSGAVLGTNSVGGVVGMNSGAVRNSLNTADVTGANTHVGGVVGNHVGGEITRCGNSGNVTGASDYIGGVTGVCSGAVITESFNTGNVTGAAESDAVGGVVGAIDGTNLTKSVIANCFNTGAVTGRGWVGGIAGVSGYQKTPQAVEFTSSYNTGTVTGTSHFGAVVGALNKGTVSGSYYLTGCASARNTLSGAAEATAAQFTSGEIAYALNGSGERVWYQNLDRENAVPDASPVLDPAHGVVYMGYKNCTESGYTNREDHDVPGDHVDADNDHECDLCHEQLEDPHTHSFGDWSIATAPTCTENGLEIRSCACGETERREIAALGHDYINGDCSRCDAVRDPVFTDVPVGLFCFDPVEWAVENGITTGTTDTTFDPNGQCVRAVVVTFLWRAAGEPEPTITTNPFVDVNEREFYYKAVLWAVEKGITTGISATEFAPLNTCNRAQVVTFLYRAMGNPEITSAQNPFSDVQTGQFYTDAVLWAVEQGITNGISTTEFAPLQPCNRAQVVTFLYRAMA